jgi:hypothetical protein
MIPEEPKQRAEAVAQIDEQLPERFWPSSMPV